MCTLGHAAGSHPAVRGSADNIGGDGGRWRRRRGVEQYRVYGNEAANGRGSRRRATERDENTVC